MINQIANVLSDLRQRSGEIVETDDAQRLRAMYDEYMMPKGVRDDSDGFHPSALGTKYGNCNRRAVYILRGTERNPDFDARTMRIFGLGHNIHDMLQGILKDLFGDNFEAEVEVCWNDPEAGTPIRGHADGVLIIPWNGMRIIIEIKSVSQNAYDMRLEYRKAKVAHFDQANIYAYTLDCERIWFIYYNKNTSEYLIFDQPADREAAAKQIAKWTVAWKIHERGELPARPYKMNSEACTDCDLRDLCWSDEDEGVKK